MTFDTVRNPLLTRKQLAALMTERGFKISPATLATFASRQIGPPYLLFGRTPMYDIGESIKWALARMSVPRRHTFDMIQARCP